MNEGTLSLSACTLSQNSGGDGGAIFNSGTLSLSACTLSQNSGGDGTGGAILNFGTLSLSACTLSQNSSGGGGGGIFNTNGSSLSLSDTILANNSAANGPDLFLGGGTITTTGTNLLSDLSASTLIAGPTVLLAADPLLAPLGDYGGPTQTMPPLPGSLAIDTAGNIDPGGTDQRGFTRFFNGALDIGAVEVDGIPPTFNNRGLPWGLERIEAEDFDTLDTSYLDNTVANLGASDYRNNIPVDIEPSGDTDDNDDSLTIAFTQRRRIPRIYRRDPGRWYLRPAAPRRG